MFTYLNEWKKDGKKNFERKKEKERKGNSRVERGQGNA